MIAALRTPARRIAVAALLSVLVHGVFLWLPDIQLPHNQPDLPPLLARLEPLPARPARPVAKPAAKPKPGKPPKPAIKPASPATQPDKLLPPPAIEAASAVEAVSSVAAASSVAVAPAVDATPVVAEQKTEPPPPLPKHAQLVFAVYKGTDNFRIGEVHHQLDISGDEYTLKAVTQTVGLAKWIKNYQLTQISRGKVDKYGLQPGSFEEEKIIDHNKQSLNATFDWPTQTLHFSQGGVTALPADAQDILSIFYQLSQLRMNREVIPLAVSNGKKLEIYNLEIGGGIEEITTPMGKVRTLHLRKIHPPGESGFEIWLGLEYRLLPMKYLQIEPSGEVVGEIAISEIRLADE